MNLTTFNFNSITVRTITDSEGNPWFVAADVASILDYRTAKDMTRNLDDDEKGGQIVPTPGGDQEMTVINESGLYSAILKSRKPEAKAFRKWVTSDVLPSIRKTGSYSVDTTPARIPLDEIARSLEVANNMLNVCPSAKLKSMRTLYNNYGVNPNILPDYTVDAPTVTAGGSEPTLSLTEILKRGGLEISTVAANKKLEALGLIRKEYRTPLKSFWVITDAGLKYGKNLTSDKNQRETQPHWYIRTMDELLGMVIGRS